MKEVEELNDKLQADKDSLNKKIEVNMILVILQKTNWFCRKIINKASDSAARCVEIASQ